MVALAKQAMRVSLLKLLADKPFHQITVKEIVEDCGINRNTFYYHFKDLNELLETTMDEVVQRIVRAHPTVASVESCFDALVEFVLEHRQAMLNLFYSEQRAVVESYLWRVFEYLVTTYLQQLDYYRHLNDADRLLMVDYHKSLFFGLAMHWLKNGLRDDVQHRLRRLFDLKHDAFCRQVELFQKQEKQFGQCRPDV